MSGQVKKHTTISEGLRFMRENTTKRIVAIGIIVFILLGAGMLQGTDAGFRSLFPKGSAGEQNTVGISVELYYFNGCETCREYQKFEQEFKQRLRDAGITEPITCTFYNAFHESEREYISKRMEELGVSYDMSGLPAALVNGRLYQGTYGEIGDKASADIPEDGIRERSAGEGQERTMSGKETTDTELFLFTTYACDNCSKVKEYLNEEFGDGATISVVSGEESILSNVYVTELNIMEEGNLALLDTFMEEYAVPDDLRQVPILFYAEGFLSGEENIKENLMEELCDGAGLGFVRDKRESPDAAKTGMEQGWSQIPRLFMTGLINGVNPCAASMLLMVLSILLVTKKFFLRGSLLYLAGKVTAYMMMGLGAFGLFQVVQEAVFVRVQRGIEIAFAAAALSLCLLNLYDFRNTRKKQYGKVVVQLPGKLRKWNHNMIEKLKNVSPKRMLPAVFLLGLVISAGEFFCTGQLYVASIFILLKQGQQELLTVAMLLLVYMLAMCIPQLVLILVIYRSKNLLSASRFTLEGMPVVKLIYAGVFLALFFLLLYA